MRHSGYPAAAFGVALVIHDDGPERDSRATSAFYLWQNLHERDDGIAIEPATCRVGGREDWKRRGVMIWLEHGEARDYRLEVEALVGSASLDAAARAIDARD